MCSSAPSCVNSAVPVIETQLYRSSGSSTKTLTRGSRRRWEIEGPLLTGWEVFHATRDPRDGALYVAANNFVYGATVQRSDDGGKTWERSEQLAMPDGMDPLKRMWH